MLYLKNTQRKNNKRFKLILINPKSQIKQYVSNYGFARLIGKKASSTPLALPLLASYMPSYWDVEIFDEEIEELPKNISASLVGITGLSNTINRAYQIADLMRQKNIPVVMGGPYVSFNANEALAYADHIIIGEADDIWGKFIKDFENNTAKKIYKQENVIPYKKSLIPRWDLIDVSKLAAIPVQLSRGCPYNCDFCLVSEMFGTKMRYREIDDVINEIKSLPKKTVFFVDDNLTANKEYSKEFFKRLKPLKIAWMSQASIEIADYPEILDLMADSGCMHLLIGFETLNSQSLNEAHKIQNKIQRYSEAIEKIHRAGITICSSWIVGFDNDTLQGFDNIYNFLTLQNLWYVNLNILDVIPGTKFYNRIVKEGRWINRDAKYTGGMFPTIKYKNMTMLELFNKYLDTMCKIYSWEDVGKRITNLISKGYFNNNNIKNPDTGFFDKIIISFKIIWIFLIKARGDKRKIFITLFNLVRKKQIAPDKIVFLLLTVEGVNNVTSKLLEKRTEIEEYLKLLEQK